VLIDQAEEMFDAASRYLLFSLKRAAANAPGNGLTRRVVPLADIIRHVHLISLSICTS